MKSEDIIEGLNKHIETRRKKEGINTSGHLILHKDIEPHSSFKAYKTYRYTLWFVKNKKSYRVLILQHIDKVLDNQEENMIRKMNIMFSELLFNWIRSDYYIDVINGTYKGVEE